MKDVSRLGGVMIPILTQVKNKIPHLPWEYSARWSIKIHNRHTNGPGLTEARRRRLTQWDQVVIVLQHHMSVQVPLSRLKPLPLLLGEVYGHISESYRALKWHTCLHTQHLCSERPRSRSEMSPTVEGGQCVHIVEWEFSVFCIIIKSITKSSAVLFCCVMKKGQKMYGMRPKTISNSVKGKESHTWTAWISACGCKHSTL